MLLAMTIVVGITIMFLAFATGFMLANLHMKTKQLKAQIEIFNRETHKELTEELMREKVVE